MTTPLVSVRDIHVEIDTRRGLLKALRGISFDVEEGASVGIVGESGSGKSIALKAILGLLPKNARMTSGEIWINGVQINALPKNEQRKVITSNIGMIFQDAIAALNPVMTIGKQITEIPIYNLGWDKERAKSYALEIMNLVGIPEAERRFEVYPHQLSGGLRQRIAVAIALSGQPKVLFCDEPTTSLDVTIQAQVLKLLMDLRETKGTGLVFVTHDLAVVNEICDDLKVMYAGRLVETGAVASIFDSPSHPYSYSLLKAVPDVDHPVERLFSITGEAPDLTEPVVGCPFSPRCFASDATCEKSEPNLVLSGDKMAACYHSSTFLRAEGK